MSSTFSTSVVAFLSIPLHVNDLGKKTGENTVNVFPPLLSPPPPSACISFDPDDETEEPVFRSPPTSDPVQNDGIYQLPWIYHDLQLVSGFSDIR